MQLFRFLRDLVRSFLRHGCASLAASLAFFSLLSLFPLVFLLLYGLSFVVSQDVIGAQVLLSFLKGFFPLLGEHVVKELHRVSALETVRWVVFLKVSHTSPPLYQDNSFQENYQQKVYAPFRGKYNCNGYYLLYSL